MNKRKKIKLAVDSLIAGILLTAASSLFLQNQKVAADYISDPCAPRPGEAVFCNMVATSVTGSASRAARGFPFGYYQTFSDFNPPQNPPYVQYETSADGLRPGLLAADVAVWVAAAAVLHLLVDKFRIKKVATA